MSVRTFRQAADFPQNIRQALREGQEPVLAFSVHPFYRGKKAAFFQQGMQTPRTHEIYISMEDADWTQKILKVLQPITLFLSSAVAA